MSSSALNLHQTASFDKWNSSIPFHPANSVALLFVPKIIFSGEPWKVYEISGSLVVASNSLCTSRTTYDQTTLVIFAVVYGFGYGASNTECSG
jgi:hypothetical protein